MRCARVDMTGALSTYVPDCLPWRVGRAARWLQTATVTITFRELSLPLIARGGPERPSHTW